MTCMLYNFFVYVAKGVAIMDTESYMPNSSALIKVISNCFVIFASVEFAAIL